MSQQTIFHLMSDLTKQEGISCVLIGGFAVNCYGVTRQTADVDFLITKKDFDKIIILLEKSGYTTDLIQENFAQLKSKYQSFMNVDFMFIDSGTLSKVLKEVRKIRIGKQEFLVPCLNHLIALKLHSIKYNQKIRLMRDLPDIINLIRINKVNVKAETFRKLCFKFGTEEIYKKILEALE
ncbi:MAG TPA: hypothetical protein DD723_09100 [Candidatus Omnitrophica bacterium]|nr:MAG: hypothetical protein A2Z81_08700 [Omnitrophica WOR_2 bacterium GWA2_45_18]HBR15674.1 hypothetical protein [Candidatus Omnitrophota bacterium]